MRYTKNDALVFRNYRVNGCPTECAEQPSAKFSPHDKLLLYVYIFQFRLASEVLSDEVLSVDCVVSHVELHDFGN